jgi:Asp-tRNAAsn/Glu-tRNAGln amidotransferase A subunit and related amidases
LANGQFVGPLHGVPVTIKDHEAVRGMQIEYGTHLRRGDVAAADSAMVSRLRRAGAIIFGKTATPEFGWMGVSNSPLTGITHNPWKLGLNAGASRREPASARRPATARCIRAATARVRSACRRISAASMASSRAMAACRSRRWRPATTPCISAR